MRLHSKSFSKAKHAEFMYSAKERDERQLEMMEDDNKHELKQLEREPGCLLPEHDRRAEPEPHSEDLRVVLPSSRGFGGAASLASLPGTLARDQGEGCIESAPKTRWSGIHGGFGTTKPAVAFSVLVNFFETIHGDKGEELRKRVSEGPRCWQP